MSFYNREGFWNLSGESSQFLARQFYLYVFKEKGIEVHRDGKEQEIFFFRSFPAKKVVDGHYLCKVDLYVFR